MKYLIVLIFLVGCSDELEQDDYKSTSMTVCSGKSKPKIANFILTCIKNANPKSDEEPEDWIKICQSMAEDTYCKKVDAFYTWNGSYWSRTIPCTEAKTIFEKNVCRVE